MCGFNIFCVKMQNIMAGEKEGWLLLYAMVSIRGCYMAVSMAAYIYIDYIYNTAIPLFLYICWESIYFGKGYDHGFGCFLLVSVMYSSSQRSSQAAKRRKGLRGVFLFGLFLKSGH